MKPERLDVTSEELEALLEGVRAPLGEVSYQKLQAAIHTLSYLDYARVPDAALPD